MKGLLAFTLIIFIFPCIFIQQELLKYKLEVSPRFNYIPGTFKFYPKKYEIKIPFTKKDVFILNLIEVMCSSNALLIHLKYSLIDSFIIIDYSCLEVTDNFLIGIDFKENQNVNKLSFEDFLKLAINCNEVDGRAIQGFKYEVFNNQISIIYRCGVLLNEYMFECRNQIYNNDNENIKIFSSDKNNSFDIIDGDSVGDSLRFMSKIYYDVSSENSNYKMLYNKCEYSPVHRFLIKKN